MNYMNRALNQYFYRIIWIIIIKIASPSVYTPIIAQSLTLDKAIEKLCNDSVLQHGQVGLCIVDVQTGQIIASVNPSMSLIPASNMKIVTTAAGLKILGNDFNYRTELQHDGIIKDSILEGNIIIKGYGDPTLGSPLMANIPNMQQVLDSFSQVIKGLGIHTIKGKIIGDGSAFERSTATATWLWEDLGNYYGAGPSGLNLNENLYELHFTQNPTVGSPPSVSKLVPHVPHFQMYNEVISKNGGGDDSFIYCPPYSSIGIVKGAIPAGNGVFKINGSIPDAPFFTAWHLKHQLEDKGIRVTDSATTQIWLENKGWDIPTRHSFFTWLSPPLSQIVERTNQESVNLYCEAILRSVAFKSTGLGSNDTGIDLVKKFWQEKGIDTKGFFMQDGSGLSPRNGITPMQLTNILRMVAQDSTWFVPFYQSLPEAGHTGTMKGMFKKYPSVIGKIRAKSGSISRVRAYSGYATASNGRMLAFSLMLNNFTCSQSEVRKRIEEFLAEVVKL